MAVEWKELDFFGEFKQIPKKIFSNGGEVVLSQFSSPSSIEALRGSGSFSIPLDLSSFPNYKHCTIKDFIIGNYRLSLSIEGSKNFEVDIYGDDFIIGKSNYDPETGLLTLYVSLYPVYQPTAPIKVSLTNIEIYSLYDVSIKEIK